MSVTMNFLFLKNAQPKKRKINVMKPLWKMQIMGLRKKSDKSNKSN